MSTAVVTTFSPKGYGVYGKRMIDSFAEHWPADVPLFVFYEGAKPEDANPRAIWCQLDSDKDRAAFLAVHKDEGGPKIDYRFLVATYSHKVFAYTAVPHTGDWLIWLDGDIETFAPVTHDLLKHVQPDGMLGSYLGRPWFRHSETGFLCFRLDDTGKAFLRDVRSVYTSGEVKKLPEWHDCMVFDRVRKLYERKGYRFLNLSKDCNGLAVFEQTVLGKVMRHNKGPAGKQKAYGDDMLSREEA